MYKPHMKIELLEGPVSHNYTICYLMKTLPRDYLIIHPLPLLVQPRVKVWIHDDPDPVRCVGLRDIKATGLERDKALHFKAIDAINIILASSADLTTKYPIASSQLKAPFVSSSDIYLEALSWHA